MKHYRYLLRCLFFIFTATVIFGCASYPNLDLIHAVKENDGQRALKIASNSNGEISACKVLYYAAEHCRPEVARLALDAGVLPHCTSGTADSLWVAAGKGCISVATILLDRGADINYGPRDGRQTALDAALIKEKTEMIAFLQSRGGLRGSSDVEIAKWKRLDRQWEAEDKAIEDEAQRTAASARSALTQMFPPTISGMPSTAIVGSQVLSPTSNARSTQRQPVENMNRCKKIRLVKGKNYYYWELYNNCPVPVHVSWCGPPGCRGSGSADKIPAGSKINAVVLHNPPTSEPGGILYCPANTVGTTANGVWACWPTGS